MLINHFAINNEWFLVDLPGYGYAKRGKKEMEKLRNLIEYYVLERKELTCLFVLIDSRLTPQRIDLEFIQWLGEEGVPFSIIFTKADKNKTGGTTQEREPLSRRTAQGVGRIASALRDKQCTRSRAR